MSRPGQTMRVFALGAGCEWSLAALLSQSAAATPVEADGIDILLAYIEPGVAGFVIVTVLGFVSSIGYWARSRIGRMKRRLFGRGEACPADNAGSEARVDPDAAGEGGASC